MLTALFLISRLKVLAAQMSPSSPPPQAFFTDTYIQEHPGDHERIEALKHLIALQVNSFTLTDSKENPIFQSVNA